MRVYRGRGDPMRKCTCGGQDVSFGFAFSLIFFLSLFVLHDPSIYLSLLPSVYLSVPPSLSFSLSLCLAIPLSSIISHTYAAVATDTQHIKRIRPRGTRLHPLLLPQATHRRIREERACVITSTAGLSLVCSSCCCCYC